MSMRLLVVAAQTAVLGSLALVGTWVTATNHSDYGRIQSLAARWTRLDAMNESWLSPADKIRLGMTVAPEEDEDIEIPAPAAGGGASPEGDGATPLISEVPVVGGGNGGAEPENGGASTPDAPTDNDASTGSITDPDSGDGAAPLDPPGELDLSALAPEIDLRTAKMIWDRNQVTPHDPVAYFVDARGFTLYEAGHIPYAFSIPYTVMRNENVVPRQIADGWLDASYGKPVIVYCDGGDCDESLLVAQDLQDIYGFKTHVMVAGFPDWKAAGYPTGSGPDETLADDGG